MVGLARTEIVPSFSLALYSMLDYEKSWAHTGLEAIWLARGQRFALNSALRLVKHGFRVPVRRSVWYLAGEGSWMGKYIARHLMISRKHEPHICLPGKLFLRKRGGVFFFGHHFSRGCGSGHGIQMECTGRNGDGSRAANNTVFTDRTGE